MTDFHDKHDDARSLAEQWKGRADDAGRLSRAVLATSATKESAPNVETAGWPQGDSLIQSSEPSKFPAHDENAASESPEAKRIRKLSDKILSKTSPPPSSERERLVEELSRVAAIQDAIDHATDDSIEPRNRLQGVIGRLSVLLNPQSAIQERK